MSCLPVSTGGRHKRIQARCRPTEQLHLNKVVRPTLHIDGGNSMKPKLFRLLAVVALFGAAFILNSCGSGQANCPVCGTDKNGTIGLIDVMLVPEHNPNGEPGGPFNIFDIGWTDPVNRLYYVTDRIGLDVPVFSTVSDTALWAIGGDNSVAEAGYNASVCWKDTTTGETIPSITTAQGNYTRFGCKTNGFRLPGGFGPNGDFGGFVGGQCCASRANNLNPLTGPNGLEASADGNFLFVGNGSSALYVFDVATSKNYTTAPTLTAVIPTGTSPDYDGLPNGVGEWKGLLRPDLRRPGRRRACHNRWRRNFPAGRLLALSGFDNQW